MDPDELLLETEERMEKAVAHLKRAYRGIRTGRATPGLVDQIRVEAYGSQVPLKQVANVAAPEANLLVIKPYDPSITAAVERAILVSELGIHPQSDGKVIRLVIPPLSEESRRKYVAQAKELAEEARISIRNVRRDANKQAQQMEKEGLSEDLVRDLKEQIQDLTKQYESRVDELFGEKSSELMKID